MIRKPKFIYMCRIKDVEYPCTERCCPEKLQRESGCVKYKLVALDSKRKSD